VALWRNIYSRLVIVATIAAIPLTPPLLKLLALLNEDWKSLSDVSQAYGFLSVIFSGAALIGVATSIIFQAHQTKISNEEERRAALRELILTSINNPEFLVCWQPSRNALPLALARQLYFTHLIVTQWHSDYVLKRANDEAMRVQLALHFKGERAREHWVDRAAGWREYAEASKDARQIRFTDLMDEAYANSVAAGPPIAASSYFTSEPDNS
jgi:hypothetical protein